jgi:3-methyladenine DNA glycosylase AlkD
MNQEIRDKLLSLAEEDYKKFQGKLIPGEDRILGVRLPELRTMAKEIAKKDWQGYLESAWNEYYEEIMLQGLVIGYAKAGADEILYYVKAFIPKITNWGVCDSCTMGLKIAQKHPEQFWNFIQDYVCSEKEFEIRFAVVMMLAHFVTDTYIDQVLPLLDSIRHDGYYVKMGVAWTVSVCFVKFPEKTMNYLKDCGLDDFTFNKSLQKILESYRIDQETKVIIRSMKRESA